MAVKVQKILRPIVQPEVKPDITKFGSGWNKLDSSHLTSLELESSKIRTTCPFCGYVGQYFAHAIDSQGKNLYVRYCESCQVVYQQR